MRYRAALRGFDLDEVERILRFGEERYFDRATGRVIAVGKHGQLLVMIPCDQVGADITPVTIHTTTRRLSENGARQRLTTTCSGSFHA